MSPQIQVTAEEKEIILNAIHSQLGEEGVHVSFFGSRAKGTARPGSDLDIMIESESGLPPAKKAHIEDILENSNLPYKVDLVDKNRLNKNYREEILKSLCHVE